MDTIGAPELPPEPAQPSSNLGPSERHLASLKSFARIAWEECRKPLTDAAGSAQVRWEIYSTWTLLLCLHHAEAEAERCLRAWEPKPWRTEAQALRHIFLSYRSARVVSAVLRWLRWVHRWTQPQHEGEDTPVAMELEADASYERTRYKLQLITALPTPLRQPSQPLLHPDGPLQQRSQFEDADLEEERRLIRQLWVCLRRGDLRGALSICTDRGQAWRATLLQGMMPCADGEEEEPGYDMPEDGDEDLLAKVKEDHTDWTELGVLDGGAMGIAGNPWRKVWKEQCWDTAQRQCQADSAMDQFEVAIYGFCAGHYDAMMPVCGSSWADRCWCEMHCLKEWLMERLLDEGRDEWCPGIFLGEGDGGIPDGEDTEEEREHRALKLRGRLHGLEAADLEGVAAREVGLMLRRLCDDAASAGTRLHDGALAPFTKLQACLIEAAWVPQRGEAALDILRDWLARGFDGTECPFLVKQFASYFAIWQKDVLAAASSTARGLEVEPARSLEGVSMDAPNVDDIVRALVQELVAHAAGSWVEQCLEGQALELIAEHVSALSMDSRLEAFIQLIMELGSRASFARDKILNAKLKVLRRAFWVYWGRYPQEAFALITVFVRRVLRIGVKAVQESNPSSGDSDDVLSAQPVELIMALECIIEFWVVVRERAADGRTIKAAVSGFDLLLEQPYDGALRTTDDFARASLDLVVLPLLTDTIMSLAATADSTEIAAIVSALSALKGSLLWEDTLSCGATVSETLDELVWYLGLCERYHSWDCAEQALQLALASSAQPYASAALLEAELEATREKCDLAHNDFVKCASIRLAQDRPLLEPVPDAVSLLCAHWRVMQKIIASKVLFLLLSIFEKKRNFEGAMNDLIVAVAQSPWMLQLARAPAVRDFLLRLSRIPTLMPTTDLQGCEPAAGAMLAVMG